MNKWIEQFLRDGSDVRVMRTRLHYAGIPERQAAEIRDAVIKERIRRSYSGSSVTDELVAMLPGVQ